MNEGHKAWIDNELLWHTQHIFVEFIKVKLCGKTPWIPFYYHAVAMFNEYFKFSRVIKTQKIYIMGKLNVE